MVCVSVTNIVVTKCKRLFGSGSGQIRFCNYVGGRGEEGGRGGLGIQFSNLFRGRNLLARKTKKKDLILKSPDRSRLPQNIK